MCRKTVQCPSCRHVFPNSQGNAPYKEVTEIILSEYDQLKKNGLHPPFTLIERKRVVGLLRSKGFVLYNRTFPRKTFAERAALQTHREGDCILWKTGSKKGYATVNYEGKSTYAHRVSYELSVGPIPDGMEIDHLCRHRNCINPAHLEAVTPKVNIARMLKANPRKRRVLSETCGRGHSEFKYEPNGNRYCIPCRRASNQKCHSKRRTIRS